MNKLLRAMFASVLIIGILQSIFATTYVVTTRYELKSGYPENAVTAVETDTDTEYGPIWGLGFKIPPPYLTYTVDYSGNWLGVLLAILGTIGLMLSKKRMRNPLRLAVITLLVTVCIISVASIPYLKMPGTVVQGNSTISPVHSTTQGVISEWLPLAWVTTIGLSWPRILRIEWLRLTIDLLAWTCLFGFLLAVVDRFKPNLRSS